MALRMYTLAYANAVVSRHNVTSYVFTDCTTEAVLVHCSQHGVIRLLQYTHGTAATYMLLLNKTLQASTNNRN